ncbi:MAG: methyltransferase domain-containing protein [Candidatus Omnitrophica bacterium]|nr:methyltransferase domain-containing protein [Candidatus Omnitrophota bacterium]
MSCRREETAMMELTESQRLHLPRAVHWQDQDLHLLIDPEAPHWIAADSKGAMLIGWVQEGLEVGEILRRYAAAAGLPAGKAWLHVHDFLQALLRVGFASREPVDRAPYLGRAAYARPTGLKELWLHTNNICNLACSHCLVESAPWVEDWGLTAGQLLEVIDEAVELGVDRFYMTGGEPFMRRDLFELIRAVTGSKGCELILLTNGTLLKGERAEALNGLSRQRVRFQVSLDGATAAANDPIRGEGSFEAAVAGLRLLVSLGFQTSVTTVVTARNLNELEEITRLAHSLGVPTQHLMWTHRRGRIVKEERGTSLGFPEMGELIAAVRRVKGVADSLGVRVDNWESVRQRVNSRPGVKYDLGNACWDSLCLYSDGTLYPSAALANVRPLALGRWSGGGSLRRLWQESPVARLFREATVAKKMEMAGDPLKFLTGGGDLEQSICFGLNGESGGITAAWLPLAEAAPLGPPASPERLAELLRGPDPYAPLYEAMVREAMWEIARSRQAAVNRRSGYDAPRLLHAMGQGAIHCATEDLAVTGEVDVRTLHSNCVLAFDVDKPRRLVREFYSEAAETPKAELCCPTRFDPALVGHIPQEVVERFYGCGSPVTMGNLMEGETFLDLGSGAGIDCFIAAKLVGPAGRVIGVDMTDPMLEIAGRNRPVVAARLGYSNVEFRKGFLEAVPAESGSADLVTSNCVINLSPDKPKVFAEIWRVLKDNGRAVIADIVSDRPVPAHLKVNPRLWGECVVGALTEEEFLTQLQEAGLYGISILKKAYWKTVEGFDFYSVTIAGYKFEKKAGCRFVGQRAVYLGPMKGVLDEEGHLFPRGIPVEVCTDTAAKLSHPPYAGSFAVIGADAKQVEMTAAGCGPGCC